MFQGEGMDMSASFGGDELLDMDFVQLPGQGAELC